MVTTQSVNGLHAEGTRIGDACAYFDGWIKSQEAVRLPRTPDDFFFGLTRIDSPGGPVFRKGSQIFTHFPEEVHLQAQSIVVRCSKDMKYLGEWPQWAPEFVKGLRAEAGFIRDLRYHPLEIKLVEERATTYMHHNFWSYHFVIETKDVRLTDTLVVYLRSKNEEKMGHFKVDLAGRTRLD